MKLAVLTNILTPYRIPLFEAMQKRVDDLTVLLMAEREENRQWNLKAHPFKTHLLPGIHVRPPGYPVSMHWNHGVVAALRRFNPDLVLSGGFAPANMAALIYCKRFRKKFVGWGELTQTDIVGALIRRRVRRWLIGRSDGAIASSSEARDVFIHYGLAKDQVLTAVMPIDVSHFHERAEQFRNSPEYPVLREKYAVRREVGRGRQEDRFGPILFSVGRITEMKGYPELFRIYGRILEARPDVSLLIAGDGPDRPAYERVAREKGWSNIHFTGFVQADELPKFLAISDIFVFHTLFDHFGAVLSEAMAAELPVVSSIHAAATRDLVQEGVTGFRINPRNIEISAATILQVLNMQPEERVALGRAGYEQVRRYDIPESADSMIQFLASRLKTPAESAFGRVL
ncbi:MAG: glycosyltransferase family 4 protein [Candidatus Manganitrophaceae bacterium]